MDDTEILVAEYNIRILFRAFQGIGGAGIFSMAPIIVAEMVTPEKYGAYNAILSLAIAFSFLLGPLIGGAVSDDTTWRWIFYINLPVGLIGLIMVSLAMPAAFPDVSQSPSRSLVKRNVNFTAKIDYLGFFLLLAASVFLIVAIEEAGTSFAWDSVIVITFLFLSVSLLGTFFAWQRYLYLSMSPREPVFPWEFMKNRVLMGMYL
jgi:MFS family permease